VQHLWAPWRSSYIQAPKEAECFLCRKSRENADAANLVVVRRRACFGLLNAYPYTAGHLMVAPYKHTGELEQLSDAELTEMMQLTILCKRLLTSALKPDGFNIGLNLGAAAGAGVLDHLHLHIVPRWSGDTNFTTVLADTRVLPQSLDEVLRRLTDELKTLC
jgi:ATP adenylyltransferase